MIRTIIICMVLFCSNLFADSTEKKLTESDVNNLIRCIESENTGVRFWGVFFAGEYNVREAVLPLIKILQQNNDEYIREIAVHSLYRIGDIRGLLAIREAAKYDNSDDVKKLCDTLVKQLNLSLNYP